MPSRLSVKNAKICVAISGPMIVAGELAAFTAPCNSPCALSGICRDITPLIAGAARPLAAPMMIST